MLAHVFRAMDAHERSSAVQQKAVEVLFNLSANVDNHELMSHEGGACTPRCCGACATKCSLCVGPHSRLNSSQSLSLSL
jgi:hypothetical protein